MADADLQITIGADASGVQAGAAAAASSIQLIKPAVGDSQKAVEAFGSALAEAVKSPNLDGLKTALANLGATLATTGGAYGAMAGAAMLAGVAVIDLTQRIGEGAKQTETIAEKFGVSVTQAQALQATAALLGTNVDEVARATAAGSGAFDQYNKVLAGYGVQSADAVDKGLQLAAASNETKVAMAGFGNVLTEALAPTLTVVVQGFNDWIKSLGESYRQGGEVKTIIDGLVDAFKILVISVVEIGAVTYSVFATIDGACWMLAGVVAAMVDDCVGLLRTAWDAFKTFGDVARDALTLNWGAILGDINDGLDRYGADVAATAAQMGKDAAAGFKKGADEWTGSDKALAGAEQFEKSLWGGASRRQTNVPGGGQTRPPASSAPTAGGVGSGGGAGGGSAQIVGPQDHDALKALQDDLAELQVTHNTTIQNMNAVDLAFWQDKAARAKSLGLTEAQVDQVKATINKLTHTAAMQALEEEDQAAKRSAQERIQVINTELAEKKKAIEEAIQATEDAGKRGEISRQAAHDRVTQLIDEEVQAEEDAARKIAAAKMQADTVIMANNDSTTKAYKDSVQDWIAAGVSLQDALTKAAADGAAKRKRLAEQEADAFKSQWDHVVDPMVSTFSSGLLKMAEGTQTFVGTMRNLGHQIAQDFLTNVVDKGITDWLRGISVKIAAQIAGNHLTVAAQAAGATQSAAIDAATNKKSIIGDAAKAASKAYAAMAGIFPAPLWGVLAGAAAFSGVMAFESLLPSAAGGYDIPAGVNPLVQTHAEEMILPARIANPLRNMLAANDAGANDGGGLGGGGNHYHTHTWQITGAIDGPSLRRVLQANPADHEAAMESLVRKRNGKGFGA
ncbi:MAG: hypothetical protein P4M09_07905 [Devosia sp.]|nr:hypothetical protein [Devosia sp.]